MLSWFATALPNWPITLAVLLGGYIIGAIPFSYLIAKWGKGVDIREHGSGNVGATNVLRTCGKVPGGLAYAMDGLKGLVPVYLAVTFLPDYPVLHVVLALMLIVGHSKSCFIGFKGGKASMTGLGALLGMAPLPGLLTGLVAVTVIALTRIVSVGSLSAAFAVVPIALSLKTPLPYTVFAGMAALLVIVRHKANIQRLLQGTEHKFN